MSKDNIQLIEFKATDNLVLPGVLFEPKKRTKKIAIFLHGNGSSSVFYFLGRIRAMANQLLPKGIAYFAFNNRGSGLITKLKRIKNKKEEKILAGTSYELIKDCIKDIDGAIKFLENQGYNEFYLIGFSTGANKICVYNYYKPNNKIAKYVLVCGGDDSGTIISDLGKNKFLKILARAKQEIQKGNKLELIPKSIYNYLFSWQSFVDIANPDGDYNTFPYFDYLNKLSLAKKKLFREYASIEKPTLVIYGDKDEYCYGRVPEIIAILKEKTLASDKFTFKIIKNADHGFTGKQELLAQVITDWFTKKPRI